MRYLVLGTALVAWTIPGSRPSDSGHSAAALRFAVSARPGGERRKPGLDHFVAGSPGKPQAPIGLAYELLGVPALGQPLAIRIDARPAEEAASLDITLGGGAEIWVAPDAARFRIESAIERARAGRTIEVVPLVDGRIEIDVLLQAVIDGRLQSRAVSIPIPVGPAGTSAAVDAALATDASGQLIVTLPATSP